MKKLLLGCLILISACQSATSTLTPASTPSETSLPTLATATVTQTLAPTQTLSPTPSPRFFTEEFDSDLSAWISFQANNESAPVIDTENGQLVFNIPVPFTWAYTIYDVYDYDDALIETSFESRGAGSESIGLVCNYTETDGWYEFNISTDGIYTVLYGQWLTQGIAQYTPIVNDTSEYLEAGETKYRLGLGCTENTLWLYINGKLFRKLDVTRFELNAGKVGLTVSSFQNAHVVVGFDWVKVGEQQ